MKVAKAREQGDVKASKAGWLDCKATRVQAFQMGPHPGPVTCNRLSSVCLPGSLLTCKIGWGRALEIKEEPSRASDTSIISQQLDHALHE